MRKWYYFECLPVLLKRLATKTSICVCERECACACVTLCVCVCVCLFIYVFVCVFVVACVHWLECLRRAVNTSVNAQILDQN